MQTLSELHSAARRYAEAGIPVFPCEVNGKRPATANGFHDATKDLEQIDKWWLESDYNIGTCPEDSYFSVIDLDPGCDFAELLPRLPKTYTVRTPRGGYHLYYEGSLPTSAGKLSAHVDTRGIGGYILLPPSYVIDPEKAIDGGYVCSEPLPYAIVPEWASQTLAKADTPALAVTEDLDLPINVGRAEKLLKKYVEEGDVAIEGQGGDDRTYRLCTELLDFGLSPVAAHRLLADIWNPACLPPWAEDELETKIANATAYQQNEVGSKAIEPPQTVFGEIVARLYPVKQSRFHFKDEQEQDDEPDPHWIIKDVITERSTVLLYAPTSSYKSFIALEMALAIATNKPTFGSEVMAGPVFYCALEGKAHLKKARRAWKIAKQLNSKITDFYLGRAPLVADPAEVQEFGDEITKRCPRPRLIIIDTVSKSMAGLNENDAKDAGLFIQFCDSLVEHFGCTVIAIHHSGKDPTKGARGSSALPSGFDTCIEVEANKKNKALAVHVRKHKDAEEREAPWTFEGRVIGGSLVFYPTTAKEHASLTNEQVEFSQRKIGAALQALAAYGQEKAVTTNVLAKQLTPMVENQPDEEYQTVLSRTARILNKGAKDYLEAYTFKNGKQTLWALLAPT